ncbi:ATP synthase F1 subunit epsilon [Telmatocola sphagniphila]|jgi:F-type H+-transporting ATPase subunit epsilon|uniref:ATP synthase F1 subunit epsilon n=1 Tax=Telmatocola sphagniphila TaxID=1123043 RepID=A0A8E6B5G8_9BACT|nr:ATP synthase F1 subunit epsilon [Telmatocola sphagniphila]QVL32293.1 ATP synthase F1 subunit epsilon [Telmatocola sphagniphila]
MKELHCEIVTPEKKVLEATAEFIVLPMENGELGVLFDHAPMIGKLGKGEVRLTHNGVVKKLIVDGGFAQIRSNVVNVLTPRVKMD